MLGVGGFYGYKGGDFWHFESVHELKFLLLDLDSLVLELGKGARDLVLACERGLVLFLIRGSHYLRFEEIRH